MALNINRTLVKPKTYNEKSGSYSVKPDLSHDIYSHTYQIMGERKDVELSVRRTGRSGGADLQIEIKITRFKDNSREGKRDFYRSELASFSLPALLAADFIKSCTEIVDKP